MTDKWEVRHWFIGLSSAHETVAAASGWCPFAVSREGLWLRRSVSRIEVEEARRTLDIQKDEIKFRGVKGRR